MTTLELFLDIQRSGIASFIGKQNHLVGAVAQLFHIAGLILILSSVVLVSLRLLGVGLKQHSTKLLVDSTSNFIWIGLGLVTVSGLLIFLPAAAHYDPNPIFWFKFLLLAIAILIHVTLYRKVTQLESPHPTVARATAVTVLSVWFGVAFAGRFIGFY